MNMVGTSALLGGATITITEALSEVVTGVDRNGDGDTLDKNKSEGKITQKTAGLDFPAEADSFFDVFFDISVSGLGSGFAAPTERSDGVSRPPTSCTDGIDNDGDALIDAADPDCASGGSTRISGVINRMPPVFSTTGPVSPPLVSCTDPNCYEKTGFILSCIDVNFDGTCTFPPDIPFEIKVIHILVKIPTLITLASFTATAGDGEVVITWTTGAEIDNEGFNILRSDAEEGPYTKINDTMIPAKALSPGGADYEFVDTTVENGKTYYYKLEDIDTKGISTLHGPIEITAIEGEESSLDITNETETVAAVADEEASSFDSSSESDSFFGCGFIKPTGNMRPPGAGQVAVTLLIVFFPLFIILSRNIIRAMRMRRLLTNGRLPIGGGSGKAPTRPDEI